MASVFWAMEPTDYGRRLAVNRLLGNPQGLSMCSPTNPFYWALFPHYLGEQAVSVAAVGEFSPATGYVRQQFSMGGQALLGDGGTYSIFQSQRYQLQQNTTATFTFTSSAPQVLAVAVVDSSVIGSGNIVMWANIQAGPPVIPDGTPTSHSHVQLPSGLGLIRTARNFYITTPAPGYLTGVGSQRMIEALRQVVAYHPHLQVALFDDRGQGGIGYDPIDPDAYPKPPYPVPTELTDPGYARQDLIVTDVQPPQNLYGDGVNYCPIFANLLSFGPFVGNQNIGGFSVVDSNSNEQLLNWNDFHQVAAGSGLVVDARTGWGVAA